MTNPEIEEYRKAREDYHVLLERHMPFLQRYQDAYFAGRKEETKAYSSDPIWEDIDEASKRFAAAMWQWLVVHFDGDVVAATDAWARNALPDEYANRNENPPR